MNEQVALGGRVGRLESAWQYAKGFGACLTLIVTIVGAHMLFGM